MSQIAFGTVLYIKPGPKDNDKLTKFIRESIMSRVSNVNDRTLQNTKHDNKTNKKVLGCCCFQLGQRSDHLLGKSCSFVFFFFFFFL